MDAHAVQLHQPISHQPQLIPTWEVMALACLVLAHTAQVNATEIKWIFLNNGNIIVRHDNAC